MALFVIGGLLGFLGSIIGYNCIPACQMIPLEYYSIFVVASTFLGAILMRIFFAAFLFFALLGIIGGAIMFVAPRVIQLFQAMPMSEAIKTFDIKIEERPVLSDAELAQRDKMLKNMREYK